MRELLDQKLARFEQLENDLINPEVLSNPARITSVAREHGSLGKLAKKYRKFKQIAAQMAADHLRSSPPASLNEGRAGAKKSAAICVRMKLKAPIKMILGSGFRARGCGLHRPEP